MKVFTANKQDLDFLKLILCTAVYWKEGCKDVHTGLAYENLNFLLNEWGERDGDFGLILQSTEGNLIGAVWYRFWWESLHSYGFISDKIPELVIGLVQEHRGKGLGKLLLQSILSRSPGNGVHSISLSVAKGNPAIHLYLKMGFKIFRENQYDFVMVY